MKNLGQLLKDNTKGKGLAYRELYEKRSIAVWKDQTRFLDTVRHDIAVKGLTAPLMYDIGKVFHFDEGKPYDCHPELKELNSYWLTKKELKSWNRTLKDNDLMMYEYWGDYYVRPYSFLWKIWYSN